MQGLIENHEAVVEYFNARGVSALFLLRRNLLRRMVSVLSNSYDRHAKLLNGTHKSHVHSAEEVSISHHSSQLSYSFIYTYDLELFVIICFRLKPFQNTSLQSIPHC